MNFWKNVDNVREYREMSRKELAYKAGFSLTSLSTGITRNSIPSADVAYRIAKTLNVSIEYLLTGKNESDNNSTNDDDIIFKSKILKYKKFIEEFDSLPESFQVNISHVISDFVKLQKQQ